MNKDKRFRSNYFKIARKALYSLAGNELMMQTKINLSIQLLMMKHLYYLYIQMSGRVTRLLKLIYGSHLWTAIKQNQCLFYLNNIIIIF